MFSKLADDLLYVWPSIKWVTKCLLSSLKVETVLRVSLLKDTLMGPLSVVENALYMISFRTPCRCIKVLKDSKWLRGSRESTYASTCGIRNLARRGKEVTSVGKVSWFARLVLPSWWIFVLSGHSSSCPFFLSLSASPVPYTLCQLPVRRDD